MTTEPAQGSREAKAMAYESIRGRHERHARQALESLREAIEKAERRLASADPLDRQLLCSSGHDMTSLAASFAEAATAWGALTDVSFFTAPDTKD